LHAALPDAAPVHVQLGVLAASRNQRPAASAAFNRALALDASSVEALGGLLALDLNASDFRAAKDRADQAVAQPSVSSEVLLLAARTYGSVKDLASAERVLRRAIAADSTLLPAYSMLAEVYLAQGRLENARQEFDNLARRQSSPIGALTMSGLILQGQGQSGLARDRFEQAVRIDVRAAAVAANNLAWMYAESGERLPEALKLAHAAADALPEAPEVLDTLGWVYFKSDLPVMAIAPLTRAVERSPKNAAYHYHLGLALAKAGEPARGRAALARALELSADAEWRDDARRVMSELSAPVSR
jgi:Tfp pilus assembly protein PilF